MEQTNKGIANEGIIANTIVSPNFVITSDGTIKLSGNCCTINSEGIEISNRKVIISKDNIIIV